MKFHSRVASIAIYFLCTLLWFPLLTNSTKNEKKNIVSQLHSNVIAQDLKQDNAQPTVKTVKLLHSLSKHIIFAILTQFLTIQEILILRETCTKFANVLMPNDKNMVIFCKNFQSTEMDEVPLIWFNLKFFRNQSYANALEKMEVFNVKENTYAIVTKGRNDRKIISWCNKQIPYLTVPFHKTNNTQNNEFLPKIYNKRKTAWVKITIEGKIMIYGSSFGNVYSLSKKVKTVLSTWEAFTILLDDGSVVAWGVECDGGKIPIEIEIQLKNIKMIFATHYSFAALTNTGRVFTWGNAYRGGIIPIKIQTQLQNINVKMIFSTNEAFAALLDNNHVVAWGESRYGGKIPNNIQIQLQNVKMIFTTESSFAALLDCGHVVSWGNVETGGIIPIEIQNQLQHVKMIFSNIGAFVALVEDGSVFAWGSPYYGGVIPGNEGKLINVTNIFPHKEGFTALCKNGDFLTWQWD